MSRETSPDVPKGHNRRSAVLAALVLVAVAGMSFWAGRVAFVPPADPLDEAAVVTYTVAEGVVGRAIPVVASARWTAEPAGTNGAAGVVTTVDIEPGTEVTSGTRLYSVDLRPVFAAAGSVPSFRDLSRGVTGADVAQLEALLVQVGVLTGEPDGRFDAATAAAVSRWQASVGIPPDGIVRAGDILFVPDLPARVTFAPELARGARLSGGENAVLALASEPDVRLLLTADMRSDITAGAAIRLNPGDAAWEGTVATVVAADEPGLFEATVVGADGVPVCGNDCATAIPVDREVAIPGEVTVVAARRGPAVPTAAIRTDAVNRPFVVTADGRRLPLRVLASARGVAVVSGIDEGTEIVLPGGSAEPTP